ncbi:hypothetical protein MHUMG1_06725 [Metarhizium humberi]|uniref:C2H2-type domain-containing protein n=1 Tax=Metarhizium humberi TaxID=2596975 RepID=A0A9P8M867_9HYPO|nr:hypothetical protein MHUMG1_06725 [Metarhizium humberi]
MTMTLDASQQQRFAPPLNFDYTHHGPPPTFSNPWSSSTSPPQSAPAPGNPLFVGSQHQPGMNMMPGKGPAGRASTSSASSMASYASLPVATTGADLLTLNRMQTTSAAYGDTTYATSASPVNGHFVPGSTAPYDAIGYAPAPIRQSAFSINHEADTARRGFPQPMPSQADERRSFADALDASHGMLAMSQDTPRNIYGARNDRTSVDSYGFPSTHSTSSSISSSGNFSSYYGDSVSDYSSAAGSDIESANSRTLPRPQGLIGSQIPPAPQSMMGQFSSKVSSSTQKKHKCKVCDKRFTRPSSLQTHMYSHTGEKPFACEVEGCGRHFSVVSNLRRHRKVHRGDARSEAGSEDHQSD